MLFDAMFQKDYILRMVEQFARVLARVMGLQASNQEAEALYGIEQAYDQFTGLNAELIRSQSSKNLIAMLSAGGELDADRCAMLAGLLKAEGGVHAAEKETTKSHHSYLKSLELLLEIILNDRPVTMEIDPEQITELITILSHYELPAEVETQISRYHEKMNTGNA